MNPNAVLRSSVWLGAALWLAYLKKPAGASLLAVRTDAIGALGGALLLAGLALHFWSNATLARGEAKGAVAAAVVIDGPYRYVRNPIYAAAVPLLLGTYLMYAGGSANAMLADLAAAVLVMAFFHWAVVRVEEPGLRARYGAAYEEYCRRVPRWIPRLR